MKETRHFKKQNDYSNVCVCVCVCFFSFWGGDIYLFIFKHLGFSFGGYIPLDNVPSKYITKFLVGG